MLNLLLMDHCNNHKNCTNLDRNILKINTSTITQLFGDHFLVISLDGDMDAVILMSRILCVLEKEESKNLKREK